MSRSKHHGCGKTCGVCKPHKKWPSKAEPKPSVARQLQDTPPAENTHHAEAEVCCDCGHRAVWFYSPADARLGPYCDSCVPRGCSCNLDVNDSGEQVWDEEKYNQPCCEYDYRGTT